MQGAPRGSQGAGARVDSADRGRIRPGHGSADPDLPSALPDPGTWDRHPQCHCEGQWQLGVKVHLRVQGESRTTSLLLS